MKATSVIYLDAKGLEHEALVFAVNPLNEGYVSLVYVDESRPEADNVVKKFDVRHMDSIRELRQAESSELDPSTGKAKLVEEGNPGLPTYHLNCWKEGYRLSNALPSDHPAYDHPHRKTVDPDGNVIPVSRPEYEAQIAAHQARQAAAEAEPIAPTIATPGNLDTGSTLAAQNAAAPSAPDAPPAAEEKGLLHKIGEDIKKGAEAVAETAVDIATSGLGAMQDE